MARIKQPRQVDARRIDFRSLFVRLAGHQSRNFYWLFGVSMFILVFGMVMVLSSSSVDSLTTYNNPYYVFGRQAGWAGVGLLGMVVVSTLSLARIAKWGQYFFAGGIFLQLLVLFTPLGISIGGNRNWLRLGIFSFQPSEFIKLGLILVLANNFAKEEYRITDIKNFLYKSWAPVGAAVLVVFGGKDLGTALIILLIAFGITLLTGIELNKLRALAVITVFGVFIALQSSSSRSGRLDAWLHPGSDDSSTFAWQSQHGIWALAAGRWGGVGLGGSKLKWSWIPEVDNDYIFAIIGEETGLLGATLTIVVFIMLVVLIRRTYLRASSSFMRNATAGIMIWIGFQSLINVSVVVQNLPVLGVPLPLVSSGGSSLISALLAIGILLAFERHIHQDELETALGVTPLSRARSRMTMRR